MMPKVSIIWLNYNSSKIMDIALESLEGIADIDYPRDRYELIVVDNGSTDGSLEKIRDFLEKKNTLRKKIIRLNRNIGFTGGNNAGFEARDPDSRYVILLNNDAVPIKDSLANLVEFAEQCGEVGALNGVLLKYKSSLIDSAGFYVDELLLTYGVGEGESYPWILRKPFYISYASGAYALYRVEYVRRCVGDRLFIDDFFAYGDDNVVGLMLWNCGYTSICIPKVAGYHVGSTTFKNMGSLVWYLVSRNRVALALLSNTRYREQVLWYFLKGFVAPTVRKKALYDIHIRSFCDALKLSKRLSAKIKRIDIYKAPLIELSPGEVLYILFSSRHIISYKMKKKIEKMIKVYTTKRCEY